MMTEWIISGPSLFVSPRVCSALRRCSRCGQMMFRMNKPVPNVDRLGALSLFACRPDLMPAGGHGVWTPLPRESRIKNGPQCRATAPCLLSGLAHFGRIPPRQHRMQWGIPCAFAAETMPKDPHGVSPEGLGSNGARPRCSPTSPPSKARSLRDMVVESCCMTGPPPPRSCRWN